jgi:predicted AlkP superfamily pyrophosphatase or phosphodiesterase
MARPSPRSLIPFALAGGAAALIVAFARGVLVGWVAGAVVLAIVLAVVALRGRGETPADPSRRRFLVLGGLGGLLAVAGGGLLGRWAKQLSRPDPMPVQEAMASDLGSEYMELVRRAYHPGRSGDLQLLLAPGNSSNYPPESRNLDRFYVATSHASVWMYLERVPLVLYGPGRVEASDHVERVTLADIVPTAATFTGFDGWPPDREGRPLPGQPAVVPGEATAAPKLIVTFVIDGGGWNALELWPDRWPNLARLMREGASYRNAITGSFPAVTACAHATIGTGTYPDVHGITGHNLRDGSKVRKAYGEPGLAQPDDLLVPTFAELWSEATNERAWIGEIGYQVWHMGMIGTGRPPGHPARPPGRLPVGVYWDEHQAKDNGAGAWAVHNPDLFRMPEGAPGLETYQAHAADDPVPPFTPDAGPAPRQIACCSPPVVRYQGDLIEATLRNEPIGQSGVTDLLFINYKAPDYSGHVYGLAAEETGRMLEEVDAQLGRLVDTLDERFPNEYLLFVTADHGQCPLPDSVDGVRLDPIQLGEAIEREFGGGPFPVVQNVVPSEVYLYTDVLWQHGATPDDVAAFLEDYRYRQNLGPYVPASAIEQERLDAKEFSAVFGPRFLDGLAARDPASFGETAYGDADPTGIPASP